MGRASNSFSGYVGQAAEIIHEDKVDLPEKSLWVAVLCRAVLDACKSPPQLDLQLKSNRSHQNIYTFDRDQARHFFLEGGTHFRHICEMAGRNPAYVQAKIKKVILRENGWNVDIPITSHYRRSEGLKGRKKRGRPKRKHLTGNAYYAAKKQKNFYYQDMGKKGGRPRIYNEIKR